MSNWIFVALLARYQNVLINKQKDAKDVSNIIVGFREVGGWIW
jgi:hypothetical protein